MNHDSGGGTVNPTANPIVVNAIVTQGLVREFGAVRAVDGVNLAVRQGEIYGFLGPNGAGKTTVINMLITLLAPTAGAITVAGFDAVAQPDQVRLHIGAALQEAALDNKQTGRELLTLQGRLYGLTGKEIAVRLADLTDLDRHRRSYGAADRHLLRRNEAASRPGGGPDSPSGNSVSRRTHYRPRPDQPQPRLGGSTGRLTPNWA